MRRDGRSLLLAREETVDPSNLCCCVAWMEQPIARPARSCFQAQAIARAQTFPQDVGVPWERSAHGYCPLAASAAHHAERVISPPAPTPARRRSPHSDDERSVRVGIGSIGLVLDRADDRH